MTKKELKKSIIYQMDELIDQFLLIENKDQRTEISSEINRLSVKLAKLEEVRQPIQSLGPEPININHYKRAKFF